MANKFIKILDRVTPGATRSLGWEVILAGLSFPASILINRTLGAEDRGLFGLVLLVPSTVITLGTCQWDRLVKGLITSKQISPKEAWRRTIYYTVYLSLIFIPLGIVFSLAYTQVSFSSRLWSALYSFSFPVIMLSGSLSAIYVAAGNLDAQYSMRVAYQSSYIFLVFLLSLLGWLSVPALLVIYFVIWLLSIVVGLFKRGKILKGIILEEKPSFSPLIRGFLPYAFESFSLNADIWAFSIFGSLITLGHYAGITGLMQPVALVSNAFTNGSIARLDWTKPSVVHRYLFKTLVIMMCLLVMLSTGGALMGLHILNLVLGKSFAGGEWMIPWIAGIVVSRAVSLQFHFALQFSGLENAYLTVQILDSVIRVCFTLILGWQFSELGILIGCIASSVVKCVICTYFIFRTKVN